MDRPYDRDKRTDEICFMRLILTLVITILINYGCLSYRATIIIIHWNTNEHKERIANEKVEKNQSSARALNSRALIFLNVAGTHKTSRTMRTYPRPSVT